MGLNMLRPSLEGAPDLPEGPGQEEEEVVSVVLPCRPAALAGLP